ncbi:SDR family NAD(P)-dependent oxidoreductase [Flammeovirga kamogawensis]|uniref:SDR family oxidoreductase n=1 Tax=Flammeovirga kamogawensis TaxID=373891 RepID=A0ABX8H1T0_9BACT|nr:SDR family oxidoreductase [Flammeovirga kamogawensis]MBB6463565.1 NAD(P)-dependent dehydrogenase (short-subunit alcohol dehydrogenase family) [Flammeovirga kamogawensis]QWG09791.1 SDR family oxidoreductase [Flammeovirga kamogawensis]TRX65299.1 SDR family oxidoreductase [Flammeovirga kamogawensis]
MKNYLVIGGSSGIGLALIKQLCEEGNMVYATYNTTIPIFNHENVNYHALNVLDSTLDLSFLPDTLNGVAYCPGSINLLPFSRIEVDSYTKDFELQVGGAIKVIQQTINKMKKSGNASIVMYSTVAVQLGFKFHAQVAASKGAIEGLTKALAAEFAPKVRVNAIAPSLTDTPLAGKLLSDDAKKQANAATHPLKKIGESEDVASLSAFLLSDKSSWMTGQILHVDGGMSTIKV